MRTDEHGSEYLPGYAERVAWLTGFTGSAAQAAVLMDRATVLSDGRYTVQLDQQVDPALFERRHLVDAAADALAGGASAAGCAAGLRPLAGAPRRAGPAGSRRQGQGRRAGRRWSRTRSTRSGRDRPPPPIAPVRLHDERHAGESSAAKRERIAAKLAEKGADVLLLTAADFDRLAAQRARRRHRLQSSGAELRAARPGRHLPLVRRSAQAARGPWPAQCRRGRADRGLPGRAGSDRRRVAVLVDPGTAHVGVPRAADGGRRQAGRGRRPLRAGEGAEERGRAAGCRRRPAPRRRGSGALPGLARRAAARRQPGRGGCRRPAGAGAGEGSAVPWPQLRLDLGARPERRPAALPRHAGEQPASSRAARST